MTALAGALSFSGRRDLSAACGRMLRAQALYGSGKPASWAGSELAMGRDLFRTLPEDSFDRGPIVAGDGAFALVADVRLDNREGLCRDLHLAPGDAAKEADSGILMHCLIRWGEAAVERLRGDFAFAFWDRDRRTLLLARDFLGQRPLHFHRGTDLFAFATMPKGLHALEEIPRAPDEAMMGAFLALMPEQGTASFFEGVERVPPGHVCTVTPGGMRMRRYWDPSPRPLILKRSEDYHEAVREQMDRAVRARLRGADGRLGTHLSGGLDSSSVTATAARLLGPCARLVAFTAVPREGYSGAVPRGRFGDEGPHAATVAALYPNVEHVLVRTGGRSPLAALDRNFHLFERPVLNLCNGVWVDGILDAARARGLSVMLTGQKGNMSFSYTGLEALPGLVARGRLLRLARHAVALRRGGLRLESIAAHAFGPYLPAWLWRGINRRRGRHYDLADYSALDPARVRLLAGKAGEAGLDFSYRPRRDPLEARLWVLERTDPGNYNKATVGGWRIDTRDPTADRDLVELCLSIPPEQYLAGGARGLARGAFSDRLPAAVLAEHRKGLQAIDWHEGLCAARSKAVEEVERISRAPGAASLLNLEMLQERLRRWPDRDWNSGRVQAQYRTALLRGISGGHFIRKASGSNR